MKTDSRIDDSVAVRGRDMASEPGSETALNLRLPLAVGEVISQTGARVGESFDGRWRFGLTRLVRFLVVAFREECPLFRSVVARPLPGRSFVVRRTK
jgi:hypothetical protein